MALMEVRTNAASGTFSEKVTIARTRQSPRSLRKHIFVILLLIGLWNSVLLTLSCFAAVANYQTIHPASRANSSARSREIARLVLLVCRCLIPAVIWMNSTIELYKYWRHALSPLRITITSSASIFLWLIALRYWTPCAGLPIFADTEHRQTPTSSSPPLRGEGLAFNYTIKRYECYIVPRLVVPTLFL